MSTTFGLFRTPVEIDDDGNIVSSYTEEDYIEIAFRSNGGEVF